MALFFTAVYCVLGSPSIVFVLAGLLSSEVQFTLVHWMFMGGNYQYLSFIIGLLLVGVFDVSYYVFFKPM